MLFKEKVSAKYTIVAALLPSIKIDKTKLAHAAQGVYDEWDADSDPNYGDAEVGFGGICQDIADAMCEVLDRQGIECATVSAQVGDQHVYAVAQCSDGVFEVDIPPSVYERGSGYNWTKIEGVRFSGDHVVVHKLDADPESFDQYTEER